MQNDGREFLSFYSASQVDGFARFPRLSVGLTLRNRQTSLLLEWKLTGENKAEVTFNDKKRPRKGQGYRRSWFGRRRRSGDVRRRHGRYPGRDNDRSIHSGVDDVGYARRRLVAPGLWLAGLGLAARMGLAALAPLVNPI
jgi:hypothetical protein